MKVKCHRTVQITTFYTYRNQNTSRKAGIPFIRVRDVNVKRERETWTWSVNFHAHTIPFIRLAWKQLFRPFWLERKYVTRWVVAIPYPLGWFCLYTCTQEQTKTQMVDTQHYQEQRNLWNIPPLSKRVRTQRRRVRVLLSFKQGTV